MTDRWYYITLPRATFTIMIRDGRVGIAPPYAWAMLKHAGDQDPLRYFQRKGAKIEELPAGGPKGSERT